MAIDDKRLRGLRRYEDTAAGLSEEYLETRLGPGRSLALLSSPLADERSCAWVLVPSIGPEHGNLRRLETLVARSLAAAGFPALRIRPDVHPERGAAGEIDLSSRLVEVTEAIELLRGRAGVDTVALCGMLFGGTVAALLADRLDVAGLALVEPVTNGKRYIRETVRRQAIAELMASSDGDAPRTLDEAGPAARPLEDLAERGATTIRGLRLSKHQFDLVSAVDLDRDLGSYAGSTLLVALSGTGAPGPGLRKLETKLASLGGEATLEVLQDPLPAPFGEYYYRNAGPVRIDTRLDLDRRIADLVARWAGDRFGATRAEAVA
jgi:pimeloyl-ACP methyl ester carboxylesterase